ncbi:alpha/beta hydrolase [Corynebacterium uterequi]|uniref:Putative esterase n=1 Tax=Corynebacterium uterequi TaxID=1072256 RepID=A0A0G3HC26_9CORY|nr:alpha/beta hydrolase family protein [Corynebacterium uterequi]AKK10240.1 putative esterase [Corynebacterium uterequi]
MNKYVRSLIPALAVAVTVGLAPNVVADTPEAPAKGAVLISADNISDFDATRKWTAIAGQDDRVDGYYVYSESMQRDIPVAVVAATNEAGERVSGAPTIYLLNGAGGAEQNNDWLALNKSRPDEDYKGTIDFYSGKSVNVVIPMDGAFSYYLDWYSKPNSGLLNGPQMWETFLTKELPGSIEPAIGANDRRAIVGFSMSATSAALLAAHNPGFYSAVAGFSGFYSTSDPASYKVHGLTLDRADATPEQMLGPVGGDFAKRNDALLNAEGLRETKHLYFSNGSGLASITDTPSYLMEHGASPQAAVAGSSTLQIEGGVIEFATNASTHQLEAKLNSLGIPATFNFRNTGTHSWPSWRADQYDSWPILQAGLFG